MAKRPLTQARIYSLTQERQRNNQTIDQLLKQAEILEARNYDIDEELAGNE